jgi:FkbH-like protein
MANWNPKHENILAIAKELNLGVDSFVFVDDNPAERALVSAQLPVVAVPKVGDQVTRYAAIIERGRFFEPVSLSNEDLERAALYANKGPRSLPRNSLRQLRSR